MADAEQMNEVPEIKAYLIDLISTMVNRAEKEVDALMPGYTHLQVRVWRSSRRRR